MRGLIGIGLAACLSGLLSQADAQLFASVDANAARATYDAYLPSGVYTLAPSVQYVDRAVRFGLDGAFSEFETGHRSGTLVANAGAGGSIAGPLHWELGGEGSTLWYRSEPAVISGVITPRLRYDRGPLTAWLGGAAGGTDNDGVRGSFVGRGEAGASWALPHLVPSLLVTTTRAGTAYYTDVSAVVQADIGRFTVNATGGTRDGALLGGVATWFNTEARMTIVDGLALVFAGGSYPADLVRGAPGAHYIAGGLRLSRSFRLRKRPAPGSRFEALNGLAEVMPDARTLRFVAPANAYVELMADFTNWQPVVMSEVQPGLYEIMLKDPIPSGPHRINIRADNGKWDAPRELPPITDDFGSTAGSLVVP